MADHDESLEVGIAAGLDVPTAMVLSEQDEKPPRRSSGSGCSPFLIWLAIAALVIFMYAAH